MAVLWSVEAMLMLSLSCHNKLRVYAQTLGTNQTREKQRKHGLRTPKKGPRCLFINYGSNLVWHCRHEASRLVYFILLLLCFWVRHKRKTTPLPLLLMIACYRERTLVFLLLKPIVISRTRTSCIPSHPFSLRCIQFIISYIV